MSMIVSVHSFRGGTGKSNVTANLAALVASRGKRLGIVDTDIQSPGIHVIFGLDEDKMDRALNDYLWCRCAIEETARDVTPPDVARQQGAIYLIPSSIKAGEIARVLREGYDVGMLNDGFRELIDQLRLDYLFIDTHPGLNEETLLSIALSDVLILILRPDRQDFQGTAVAVEVARKLEVPRMMLVVNKALEGMDPAALRQQVVDAFDAPVAAVLPLSQEMLRLGSAGLYCLEYPDDALTRGLREVAGQLG